MSTRHPTRRRLPPLDLLRGFEAAARHLSFTRAAQELFLTQSAISRQVQALEAQLGLPLFERRHRALRLTAAGQSLYRTVAEALHDLEQAVERIAPAPGGGTLTVTALVTFAALWLVPRLPAFRRQHPDVEVRISATNEVLDLQQQRIDVGIRFVAPERASASAIPLFGDESAPVCSPELLRDPLRPLARIEDLRHHVLLHMQDAPIFTPHLDWNVWLQAVGLEEARSAASLYFSHYDQLIQAAVEGQGVALGRFPLLSRHLRDKRLVMPFGGPPSGAKPKGSGKTVVSPVRAYYLVTAPGAERRPEVQAFCDWLLGEARQEAAGSPLLSLRA